MADFKPLDLLQKPLNVASLLSYVAANADSFRTQTHLLAAPALMVAMFANDPAFEALTDAQKAQVRASQVSYQAGLLKGGHLVVMRFPALKLALFAFYGGVEATPMSAGSSFLHASDALPGRLPDVFVTAPELALFGRKNAHVHSGFKAQYADLHLKVQEQITLCFNAGFDRVLFAGHGAGGAVANIGLVHASVLARRLQAASEIARQAASVVAPAVPESVAAVAGVVAQADAAVAGAVAQASGAANRALRMLEGLKGLTTKQQNAALKRAAGTRHNLTDFYTSPVFDKMNFRLMTFGAPMSGDANWCELVLSACLGDYERYVAGTDAVASTPSSGELFLSYEHPTNLTTLPFVVRDTVLPDLSGAAAAAAKATEAALEQVESKVDESATALTAGIASSSAALAPADGSAPIVTVNPEAAAAAAAANPLAETNATAKAGAAFVQTTILSLQTKMASVSEALATSSAAQSIYSWKCKNAMLGGLMAPSQVANHTLEAYIAALRALIPATPATTPAVTPATPATPAAASAPAK